MFFSDDKVKSWSEIEIFIEKNCFERVPDAVTNIRSIMNEMEKAGDLKTSEVDPMKMKYELLDHRNHRHYLQGR